MWGKGMESSTNVKSIFSISILPIFSNVLWFYGDTYWLTHIYPTVWVIFMSSKGISCNTCVHFSFILFIFFVFVFTADHQLFHITLKTVSTINFPNEPTVNTTKFWKAFYKWGKWHYRNKEKVSIEIDWKTWRSVL